MIKRLRKIVLMFTTLFVIVHFSTDLYINKVPALPESNSQVKHWYFAYGSNMSTRYMTNIRNVAIYKSLPAQADDYEVSFTLPGIAYIEPSFAIMTPRGGHTAFGVLHYITPADMLKILNSESNTYQVIDINVTDKYGKTYLAKTLVGDTKKPAINVTSTRYLNILLEGATEHGLPEAYIRTMRQTKTVYIPIVSEMAGTLIYLIVIVASQ
jgi:hypothetical protein